MPDYFDKPDIPQYSVSLFSDTASQGIAAGKSLGGDIQNIVSGVQEGIEAGQQYVNNQQTAEINQINIDAANRKAEMDVASQADNVEAARIKAENERLLQEQFQELSTIARSGDMDAYAGAVLSGKFAPLFGTYPNLQKQAVNDTFGHWNQEAQDKYLELNRQKNQRTELERQKLEAEKEFGKTRRDFEKMFASYNPTGDNAQFATDHKIVTRDPNEYMYEQVIDPKTGKVAEGTTPVLKRVYDPNSPEYDPEKAKPQRSLVNSVTKEVIIPSLSEAQANQFSMFAQQYKLINNGLVGQGGTGDLEAKAAEVRKQKEMQAQLEEQAAADINTARGNPSGDALGTQSSPTANADVITKYQTRVNNNNAPFVIMGRERLQGARPSQVPQYSNTPQNIPITPGTPRMTQEVEPSIVNSKADIGNRLSGVLGGAQVNVMFEMPDDKYMQSIYKSVNRINSLPGLDAKPAIFKGLIAVESRGYTNAVSPAGAKGLTQLMPTTADEVDVDNPLDPEENIRGGYEYLEKKYKEVDNALSKALAEQSIPQKVDPRLILASLYEDGTVDKFALASYNGGFKAIKNGIAKGITTWDEMKEYLATVKNPKAFEETSAYVDKVLAASIPFIKGGNASDEDYVQTLNGFGIIEVA